MEVNWLKNSDWSVHKVACVFDRLYTAIMNVISCSCLDTKNEIKGTVQVIVVADSLLKNPQQYRLTPSQFQASLYLQFAFDV